MKIETPQKMIAALRDRGMSQAAIAEKIGIHQTTVSKIALGADMMFSAGVKLIKLYEKSI